MTDSNNFSAKYKIKNLLKYDGLIIGEIKRFSSLFFLKAV